MKIQVSTVLFRQMRFYENWGIKQQKQKRKLKCCSLNEETKNHPLCKKK